MRHRVLANTNTVYVNPFNGVATNVINLINMSGERMPISLSLVGSDQDANYSLYNSVYGMFREHSKFHLNIQKMLIPININDAEYSAGYRFKYYDGDGTIHYFIDNGNGTVIDEYDSTTVLNSIDESDYELTVCFPMLFFIWKLLYSIMNTAIETLLSGILP